MALFCSTDHSKHMLHSPVHAHIQSLMAEGAMQGADLLIRSDAVLSIQSAPEYFYPIHI